ncbi:hypothetical protein [Pinibacter soli]|uniref:Uncharacterized protein n=1 Tax=Pinibacter soli TaxID=3044211 RepID=A0ABT6RBI7_9BACT|nr:hypothetical protein [Pinibacter soli]MDI3319913.1 hypothetical protein [Pinibacter soli]
MEREKITNEERYSKILSQIEIYLKKGFSNLTKKEMQDLELLSQAAEEWELSNINL